MTADAPTAGDVVESPAGVVLVRSTIKLPGLALGAVVYVDAGSPYIAACLERGYLTPAAAEAVDTSAPAATVPADPA